MNIALIEPFYTGSHKQWCDGYQKFSKHNITLFTLSGHHWKWRMHSGAIPLANKFLAHPTTFDLIICSDFLNVPLFKSLLGAASNIPIALYFHENQITYPWSPTDEDIKLNRDHTYGFINYSSALVADQIYFNSSYHQKSFLDALPVFLKQFPDQVDLESVTSIQNKSKVLHLGMDYSIFDKTRSHVKSKNNMPIILWNHRWEYDKNPEDFFEALSYLQSQNIDFKLITLGEQLRKAPSIFKSAQTSFSEEIIHWGYCDSKTDYAKWLWLADIIPVTAHQDFFGISLVEALYCQTYPLIPNRLAYHEHFDESIQPYVYTDQAELNSKLADCCLHISDIRSHEVAHHVTKYEWDMHGPTYDSAFIDLLR